MKTIESIIKPTRNISKSFTKAWYAREESNLCPSDSKLGNLSAECSVKSNDYMEKRCSKATTPIVNLSAIGGIVTHRALRGQVVLIVLFFIGFIIGMVFSPARSAADDRAEKFSVLAAYSLIDYDQSCDMFYGRVGYSEINPVLGKNPGRRDMLAFGGVGIAVLYLATEILPEPWATIIVDSAITSERMNVEDNARVMNGYQRQINAVPIVVTVRF